MLDVKLGAVVNLVVTGHSALNGKEIPAGSTVALTSNNPAVATLPATVDISSDAPMLVIPTTIVGVGTTDGHVTLTTPDAVVYEATATLTVEPLPEPGLVRITAEFHEVV